MGFFSSIGKIFNDITGASSAAQLNNQYQKEFAQNAHQWEVEDLKKAGLNPILSAGGQGATAGGSGGAQMANTGITDIANSAAALIKTQSDIDLQQSQEKLNDIQTLNEAVKGNYIGRKAKAEISQMVTNSALNVAKTTSESGSTQNLVGSARKLIENAINK